MLGIATEPLRVPLEDSVDLARCIAGDPIAWGQFVREVAPLVYATARRASRGTSTSVEDDAQEVFLRLVRDDFRLLRAFDPTRASLMTYLAVITRTVVHERVRRRSLPTAPEHAAAEVVDSGDELGAREREASERVSQLPLGTLTEAQRAVLVLIHEQGLSVEQAAEWLGITPQTVRSAHHKAIVRLRAALGVDPRK